MKLADLAFLSGVLLALALLSGCSAFKFTSTPKDPTCLDGYLISDFQYRVSAFCESYEWGTGGIVVGLDCSDLPNATSRAVGTIVLREGMIFETKCYNRLHDHEDTK